MIEITVPKVVKKQATVNPKPATTTKNRFSSFQENDMEVGELFLRPAVKA